MTHHVLSNLISNALKFTEKGSVHVEAAAAREGIQIDVIDTGPGIPAKDKEQLFEKFFRGMNTAHKTKGTGLGLFIVKSFVDIQRGRLAIKDNSHGSGTVISFTLPTP
jgi:signal transduction histidine kinase